MGQAICFGFWLNQSGLPAGTNNENVLLGIANSNIDGTGQLAARGILSPVPSTGFLSARRAFAASLTTLGTGNINVCAGGTPPAGYHWVEFRWVPATDATGAATLYVDGVLQFDAQNVQTVEAGFSFSNVMVLGHGAGNTTSVISSRIDDLIVWDETGTEFNTFPMGPRRMVALKPSAAGDNTSFTAVGSANPNWQVAAQPYLTASTTPYLTNNGVNPSIDLYKTNRPLYEYSDINGVVLNYQFRGAGTTATASAKLKTGTVTQSKDMALLTTTTFAQAGFGKDGYGAPWTGAAVSSMQVGQGGSVAAEVIQLNGMYAEVIMEATPHTMGQPIVMIVT
jgi:hypothetical protein